LLAHHEANEIGSFFLHTFFSSFFSRVYALFAFVLWDRGNVTISIFYLKYKIFGKGFFFNTMMQLHGIALV
jgi:hypothetical protein